MKPWMVVLLILLIGSNGWWFYRSIDQGITVAHQSDELGHRRHTMDLLASLVMNLPRDRSQEETLRLLRDKYPEEIVKVTGDTLEIDGVILVFEQDTLADVLLF